MSVKVYLPDRLRFSIAEGKHLFKVNGKTVGDCLDELVKLIPGMKQSLFFATGKLHSYIKVQVNNESADEKGLARKVKDSDAIYIRMKRYWWGGGADG